MVHTYSLPPARDLTLSHREGSFYTPTHSHRLSHISSWRTEYQSYLMPSLMWRGPRNSLQNNSRKSYPAEHLKSVTCWKTDDKLCGEGTCQLFSSVKCGRVVSALFLWWNARLCIDCAQTSSVRVWEIITIFNILWHPNFIQVVKATHWKTRRCCIFHRFCFAPSPARIFSCLPRCSRLPFLLSLCLLSLSVCLSFALSSCRVHTVQSVLFVNEAFFLCSQPESLLLKPDHK